MDTSPKPSPEPQAVESTGKRGRKLAARIPPNRVSPQRQRAIVEDMMVLGDMEAVARNHGLPVRTVDSILHWHALRRPPQRENGAGLFAVTPTKRFA